MHQVVLEIPTELVNSLKLPENEVSTRLLQELAVRLYDKELLGFGKARQLAHMDYWSFHELLAREGILRHYDVAELEEDLKTLERL